jgi:hypothetical protein
MKEQLEMRISEIEKAIQDSVVNHNGLLVRLDEAKVMLKMAEEYCAKDVCEAEVACVEDGEIAAE